MPLLVKTLTLTPDSLAHRLALQKGELVLPSLQAHQESTTWAFHLLLLPPSLSPSGSCRASVLTCQGLYSKVISVRPLVTDHAITNFSFSLFFFFFFLLFRAAPEAYGSSQAGNPIGAVVTSLHHSHSKEGSKPHLRPTPQLTLGSAGSPTHLMRPGIELTSSGILVGFISPAPQWELLSFSL